MQRQYTTGSRYAFWRWKDIGYINRLHIIQCPLGSICLHILRRPDREPYLHDHPVTFFSVILWGSYTEFRQEYSDPYGENFTRIHKRRWFNFIRGQDSTRHRIVSVEPRTVTLCFMGPNRRRWGFHTPEGWIPWTEYEMKSRKP